MPPQLYDVHETARMIRKSVSWLYQESAKGNIPRTKIGRNVFWTDAQITQIIRDGAQEPKAPTGKPARKPPAPAPASTSRTARPPIGPLSPTNIPQADRSVSRLYRQERSVEKTVQQ